MPEIHCSLKPMGDKIIVQPIDRVKSELIHVIMDEKDNMGTVIAVGPGKKTAKGREEMPIEVGSFIRFGHMGNDEYLKYTEYFENGNRFLIMSWRDVCFVTENA